ncbi:hypothetical protein Tco_0893661 [Tanacetum coccineum]|uniref:Uncharacterized protein n=1 Tax=Tanacetum coccineum TaxID=301880 RepID=A0ABQ5CFS6_9ASTR
MILVLKSSHHGPSDAMHNPSQLLRLLSKSTGFYRLSHSEIIDIEKVAVRSSLRSPNNKSALTEYRANEINQNLNRIQIPIYNCCSSARTQLVQDDLDATWKQNEILNDQLLEATLKHDIEKCVLMSNDSMNDNLLDKIEKVKRESIDV